MRRLETAETDLHAAALHLAALMEKPGSDFDSTVEMINKLADTVDMERKMRSTGWSAF